MFHRQLIFSPSLIRRTSILGLSCFLSILWLINDFGLRGVNCISKLYTIPVNCISNLWFEILFWGLVLLLIIWELLDNNLTLEYFALWKKIWPVIPFIILALLSSSWSLYFPITIVKSILLVAVTSAAVFIAQRLTIQQWLHLLAIFFSVTIIASFLLILFKPDMGTMLNGTYNGAWRGIYWHRNYLGSLMAYGNIVFLFRLLLHEGRQPKNLIFNCIFYITSLSLVLGSHSAGGIFTWFLLTLTVVIFLGWIKIRNHLRIGHYIAIGTIALVSIILVATNLDTIFGLLNRDTSMSGRIQLWNYLIQNIVSNRLFFGHGYGVIWAFEDLRTNIQSTLGWVYPALIGDNGLIDILLHLGIVGSLLMATIILFSILKTGCFALKQKTLVSFFPIISILFIVISNISLSMLIELEYFTWIVMIISVLISKPNDSIVRKHPST